MKSNNKLDKKSNNKLAKKSNKKVAKKSNHKLGGGVKRTVADKSSFHEAFHKNSRPLRRSVEQTDHPKTVLDTICDITGNCLDNAKSIYNNSTHRNILDLYADIIITYIIETIEDDAVLNEIYTFVQNFQEKGSIEATETLFGELPSKIFKSLTPGFLYRLIMIIQKKLAGNGIPLLTHSEKIILHTKI